MSRLHAISRSVLLAAALLLLAAGSVHAEEPVPADASAENQRLEVGQEIGAIEALASDGETYASSQVLSGEKRLVLVFFRGSW